MPASQFTGSLKPLLLPARAACLSVSILLAIGARCDSGSEPSATQRAGLGRREPEIIGFVGAGPKDPLWPILQAGARRYTAGSNLIVVRYAVPRAQTPQDQIDCLRDLDTTDMRGLCIQVVDADGIKPIIERLRNRGVRVVSMVNPLPPGLRNGHAGFDEREIGVRLAQAAAEALHEAGPLALLHAGYEHRAFGPRRIGFEDELRKHPRLDLFSSIDCPAEAQAAREIMADYSARFPRLRAWVALGDWPLRDRPGESIPMPDDCVLITFGGTPRQWPLIANGRLGPTVAADYGDLGYKAVQLCESALHDKSSFDYRFDAPLRTVTAADLDLYKADWARWAAAPEGFRVQGSGLSQNTRPATQGESGSQPSSR